MVYSKASHEVVHLRIHNKLNIRNYLRNNDQFHVEVLECFRELNTMLLPLQKLMYYNSHATHPQNLTKVNFIAEEFHLDHSIFRN